MRFSIPALAGVALLVAVFGCTTKTNKCAAVTCPEGQTCVASTGQCSTPCNPGCAAPKPVCNTAANPPACVECLTGNDCPMSAPFCDNATFSCVTSNPDAGGNDGGNCTPPANDECAGALALTFTNGAAKVSGDTTCATTSVFTGDGGALPSPTCAPGWQQDVVYTYTLTQAQQVKITVDDADAGVISPLVFVRPISKCDSALAADELGCADTMTPSSSLTFFDQAAGTYALWVAGDFSAGPYDLTVTLSAPIPPPANDTCSSAAALSFTGGVATATGDTTFATNGNTPGDASPTCSFTAGQDGRDVVYSYALAQPQDVHLSVTPTGAGMTYYPVIYVRKPAQCGSGDAANELACSTDGNSDAQFVNLYDQAAGTYFLWVDSANETVGPFSVRAELDTATLPPSNDGCSNPTALAFVGGVATVTGNTGPATNSNPFSDASPTCSFSAFSGPDVVYQYTLTQPQNVDITVTPTGDGGWGPYDPVLYVRQPGACASGDAGDELACVASGTPTPQSIRLVNSQPGTYFVWVDSANNTSGTFSLQATLSMATPPPANNTCAGAQLLNVPYDGGVIDFVVDTSLYTDNYQGSCSSLTGGGKDAVYAINVTTPVTVTFSANADAGFTANANTDAVLYVRQGDCDAGTEVACQDVGFAGQEELIVFDAGVGTYYLFVDSFDKNTAGPTEVQVSAAP